MRIRRTILAPAILTIGTAGALVAGPVLALTTAAAPAGTAVAVSATPDIIIMHGRDRLPSTCTVNGSALTSARAACYVCEAFSH